MEKKYRLFQSKIIEASFEQIQKRFIDSNPKYVPKIIPFEQEFDQHKTSPTNLKKSPSINGKQEFQNTQNLYLRVLSIFKSFVLSQQKSLPAYLSKTEEVNLVSQILNKLSSLKDKSEQLKLMFYLFTETKKSIRLFLKLRQQILVKCAFQKLKYHPISIHNKAKFDKETIYLQKLKINWDSWDYFITFSNEVIDAHLLWEVAKETKQILAIDFIKICLWSNKVEHESPIR